MAAHARSTPSTDPVAAGPDRRSDGDPVDRAEPAAADDPTETETETGTGTGTSTETGTTGPTTQDDPTDPAQRHGASLAEIDQAAALVGARVEHLVEDLIETELATGRREETVEEAERHIVVRIARVVAGVVVVILGITLLVAPGPGVLVIALGLGLLAQDVPFARNLLDRVRGRLPQDADGKLPRSTIAMMVVVGVGAMAVSVWFSFLRGA